MDIDYIIDLVNNKGLNEIEDFIKDLNEKYYSEGTCKLNDTLYDILIDTVSKKYPNLECLLKVGETKKESFKKLPIYLGSETKTYKHDTLLKNWIKKNNITDNSDIIVSSKADGICILIYDNIIYTRGDGIYGKDVTNKVLSILPFDIQNLRVRGELIIDRNDFDNIKNEYKVKTTRNFIIGQINKKTNDVSDKIKFVAYDLIDSDLNQEEKFIKLKSLNINTVKYKKLKGNELIYSYLEYLLKSWKEDINYDIDGLVIRDNIKHVYSNEKENYPWSISFKNNYDLYEAHVEYIEWNLSRYGKYIPKAILNPSVNIDGILIKNVTCHNARFVVDHSIGENSIVYILRSGDVIPKIMNIIKKGKVVLPTDVIWDKNNVHLIHNGEKNKDIILKQVYSFINYFKYEKIGILTLKKLNKVIEINSIIDFVSIKESQREYISSMMGIKTTEKIFNIIKDIKTKKIYVVDFIIAMGLIENVGYKRLMKVFEEYNDILNLNIYDEIYNNIILLKGYKEKISLKITESLFEYNKVKKKYENYFNIVYNFPNKKKHNYKICLSGFRNIKEITDNIKNKDVSFTIENNLAQSDFFIICNKNCESKKKEEALKIKKKIYDINEFIDYMNLVLS